MDNTWRAGMATPKTRPTAASVEQFIDALGDERTRDDCRALVRMMRKATGCPPEMWGASIIGFGRHWWTGASGKKTEWMLIAFAPRKTNLTVYLWPQFDGREELLDRLGKHSCGKGCLSPGTSPPKALSSPVRAARRWR